MSIWEDCKGSQYCECIELEPWRVVEAQHISSSRDLVDSTEEHDLLEALLDGSKPPVEDNKHYLIFTPFRYPPLKYGSRFGRTFEPSLWYGSINLSTAFSEVAYYRLKFFADTQASLDYIELPMTAFKALIQTEQGINLTLPPFKQFEATIAHQSNHIESQNLGSEMRNAGVEAFIFKSARDRDGGHNVGVFSINVFKAKNKAYINSMQNWRCMSNQHGIEFTRDDLFYRTRLEFTKEYFDNMGPQKSLAVEADQKGTP